MYIDTNQGTTDDDKDFGFIASSISGGWFFVWPHGAMIPMTKTEAETMLDRMTEDSTERCALPYRNARNAVIRMLKHHKLVRRASK